MIRSVVISRLPPDVDPKRLDQYFERLLALKCEGVRQIDAGRDRGLRAGNADFALSVLLDDDAAFRRWDADPAHNQVRKDFADLLAGAIRCQYEV